MEEWGSFEFEDFEPPWSTNYVDFFTTPLQEVASPSRGDDGIDSYDTIEQPLPQFDLIESELLDFNEPNEVAGDTRPSTITTSFQSSGLPAAPNPAPTAPNRTRRIRRPKARGPSATSWATHKAQIKNIYMVEDKTLGETMQVMKEQHGFDATLQMYKDKFQEWSFVKNIPHRIAGKLARIVDDRKPKDTEFVLGPRIWTAEEIKRKFERGGKSVESQTLESPILPKELLVRTPNMSPIDHNALMRVPPPENSQFHFRVDLAHPGRARWTPEVSSPLNSHGRPWSPFVHGSVPPRAWSSSSNRERRSSSHLMLPPMLPPLTSTPFPWQTPATPHRELLFTLMSKPNMSLRELQDMKLEALNLEMEGKVKESIIKLRFALCGFKDILAPTHDFTLGVAYDLARLLGAYDEMHEANSVLDWLGSCLVSKFGLRHERTIVHYIKVIELLRSWSREEDAELLVYKIADIWKDNDEAAPKIPGSLPGVALVVNFPEADIRKMFQEPDSEKSVEVQLRLVEILMSSKKLYDSFDDLETILVNLVRYCEENELVTHCFRVRQCLCKLHKDRGTRQAAVDALDPLLPSLQQHWTSHNNSNYSLLKPCQELAFLYYDLSMESKCEDILESTAQHIESRPLLYEKEKRTVTNFHISVGAEWQKRATWSAAEPWFERALLFSIRLLGKTHEKTRFLQDTLDNGRYISSSRDLLTSELEELISLPRH